MLDDYLGVLYLRVLGDRIGNVKALLGMKDPTPSGLKNRVTDDLGIEDRGTLDFRRIPIGSPQQHSGVN